jgi:hypothetical protein
MSMRAAIVVLSALVLAGAAQLRPAAAADLAPAVAPTAPADPAANRKASAAYDVGLGNNPAFRDNREHKECDPIESLDLRAQCLASFDQPVPTPPKPAAETMAPPDLEHPTVTITNGPRRDPGDE